MVAVTSSSSLSCLLAERRDRIYFHTGEQCINVHDFIYYLVRKIVLICFLFFFLQKTNNYIVISFKYLEPFISKFKCTQCFLFVQLIPTLRELFDF